MAVLLNPEKSRIPQTRISLAADDGARQINSGTRTSTIPSSLHNDRQTIKIGNLELNIFQSTGGLDQAVSQMLAKEIMKPGLIILPADSTHGDEEGKPKGQIYSKLNDQIKNGLQVNSNLKVTHMDELDLGADKLKNEGFAHSLKGWLPNLVQKLDSRFNTLNPQDISAYDAFIEEAGGPRVIVGGVGAEVPPHIAYIGEEQDSKSEPVINQETKKIELREEEAKRRGVKHAATMGMGEFEKDSLEKVIITAKGERKAASIKYALKEGLATDGRETKSALGMLVRKFSQNRKGPEFILNIDANAAGNILNEIPELQATPT